jgi:hypothetical protein
MVQFRRSKKFGPFRFTLSQRGLSAGVGGGLFRIGRGADGKVRRTVRIPGTGIYDVKVVGSGKQRSTPARQSDSSAELAAPIPPAGWYPDPSGEPRHRYWDGQQWTDSFA